MAGVMISKHTNNTHTHACDDLETNNTAVRVMIQKHFERRVCETDHSVVRIVVRIVCRCTWIRTSVFMVCLVLLLLFYF